MHAQRTGGPAFHVLGFPVHVRPGFLLFMVLVVVANGGELGWWIAGSAGVLTLLHELGHALAARATGARAEISLDFLAGYASFVPTRPLARWERAGISIAGPAVQIGTSLAVLALMGVDPLDPGSFDDSPASLAIWWTGPVMGLFNLVPVLPFDGGHIAQAGLDRIIPGRSQAVMVRVSVVVTIGAFALLVTNDRLRGLAYFALFPLLLQVQMLTARGRATPGRSAGSLAEERAWRTGDVGSMPDAVVPSPWFRADQQLRQGHPDVARALLVGDFADPDQPNWWPPHAAPTDRLRALVDLLPRPLPRGRAYSEQVLADVLLRVGRHEEAARYAASCFERRPTTGSAVVVARAAGALGDVDTAVGWAHAGLRAGTDVDGLAEALALAPELAGVRDDPRLVELRRRLEPA